MLVSVREHAWPNVPSVTVGLWRSKLVVLVDELGRIEGIVVIVIEGVRAAAHGVRGVVVRPGLVYGPAGLHRCRGARRGRAGGREQ